MVAVALPPPGLLELPPQAVSPAMASRATRRRIEVGNVILSSETGKLVRESASRRLRVIDFMECSRGSFGGVHTLPQDRRRRAHFFGKILNSRARVPVAAGS